MKSALLFIMLFAAGTEIFGQRKVTDSLHNALKNERTDTGRAILLYNLSYAYQLDRPDSALLFAQQAYDISVRRRFLKGEAWSLAQMGNAFREMGNNAQALNYYLQQLVIEEGRGYADNLASVNMTIAFVYNREKDTANAIHYILKADSIINANHLDDMEIYALLNTGDIFEKAGKLRAATDYTQKCYGLALQNNDSIMIGSALSNLGNIYSKNGNYENAVSSYKQSIPFLTAGHDSKSIAETELGLAKTFFITTRFDSAKRYAMEAYRISQEKSFLQNALAAGSLLTELYKREQNTDSAFAYQEIVLDLKDSIESSEKIKQVESMSINEKLRQVHLAALQQEEKEETKEKLQLLAIGIMIPIFFLVTMYISRKKVSRKLIEFSGILSLLLFFEYITLFIHPFVTGITHHSPLLEIIIFVCIAALVVPAHHRIERWFTKRLAGIHELHMQKTGKDLSAAAGDEAGNEEEISAGENVTEQTVQEERNGISETKEAGDPGNDREAPASAEDEIG